MPRILLIEPDQVLADLYGQYLKGLGYDVVSCKNAQDGINLADRKRPDLILLELLLTAHSGIEFVYEFRSYNEWRSVPVLLVSRLPRRELTASDKILQELGIVGYLYKPETSLKRLGERVQMLVPFKHASKKI